MSATRHRSEEEKAKVRQAMIEAAGTLLYEKGYDGLTLAQVGKEVGFTTTNVYRYFNSKDELIYAAAEDAFTEFGTRLEHAKQSTPDPLGRIFALGRAYVKFAEDHPVPYYLIFEDDTKLDEVPDSVAKLGYIVEAVAEAMEKGQIRRGDPHSTGDVLWGILHGIIVLARVMPFIDQTRKEAAIEEAFTLIRRGL